MPVEVLRSAAWQFYRSLLPGVCFVARHGKFAVHCCQESVSWYKRAGFRVSINRACSRSLFRTGTWDMRKTKNQPMAASYGRLCQLVLFQVNLLKVDLEQRMCVSLPRGRTRKRRRGVREVVRDRGRTRKRRRGVRKVVKASQSCIREESWCARSNCSPVFLIKE